MREVAFDIGNLNTRMTYVQPVFTKDSSGQMIETSNTETNVWANVVYKSTGGANAERKVADSIETSYNSAAITLYFNQPRVDQQGYFKMSTNLEEDTDYQIWDVENISYYPSITRPRYVVCLCRNRE